MREQKEKKQANEPLFRQTLVKRAYPGRLILLICFNIRNMHGRQENSSGSNSEADIRKFQNPDPRQTERLLA